MEARDTADRGEAAAKPSCASLAQGADARLDRAGSMSSRKKEVFISKVLKKLYPVDSSIPQPPVQKVHPETTSSTSDLQQMVTDCPHASHARTEVSNQQRVYTVSLPPDAYVISSVEKSNTTESENAESESDDDSDDSPRYHKRKRIRKKRNKSTLQCPNIENVKQKDNTSMKSVPLPASEYPTVSKNKKRKLKKKRQKEKMKAAGQLVKTEYVDFLYQPEEAENKTLHLEDMQKKSGEIQDFLQATKEIFFTDSKSKSADFCLESVNEILEQLETREMTVYDVSTLHQLKSLIVLQDTERFHSTLENFKENSTMPPEHRRVICCLFHYWITDILPIKNRK